MALHPDCARYECVEKALAQAEGFKPITSGFGIRRSSQRAILDSAIKGMMGQAIRLVRDGEKITIWKKIVY